MPVVTRHRWAALAVLAPLVVGVVGCGGSSSGGETDNGGGDADATVPSACPSNVGATASTTLPSDVPAPSEAGAPYDYQTQGATKIWFFALDGDPDELVTDRDNYDEQLTDKSYTIADTDQEPGHEAESEFDGPHGGTTNWRPLCDGKVVLRITLTS